MSRGRCGSFPRSGLRAAALLAALVAGQRWEDAVAWLERERDRLAADLESSRPALLESARDAQRMDLVAELERAPVGPRASGYGLLPEVFEESAIEALAPTERRFSLQAISTAWAADARDGALLAARAAAGRLGDPAGEVAELTRLRARLTSLEDHLDYHRYWQPAVREQADFFAERKQVLADVREWRREVAASGASARARELEQRILAVLAPFQAAPSLAVERGGDGELRLAVALVTDIEDRAFLARFAETIRTVWDESPAAQARSFRIVLELRTIPATELYPEGPPARGAALDEQAHVARFPSGALVLTTGAARTHAFRGGYLQLGAGTVSARELAHEFGHLLGFHDAYLRAYDGSPEDPWGVELVEWSGLLDDLMGDRRRPVSDAMIARLVEAYGGG